MPAFAITSAGPVTIKPANTTKPGLASATGRERAASNASLSSESFGVSPKDFEDREAFEAALCRSVEEASPDLIVLAGFMVKVPAELIKKYENRIINVHPALTPAFCGKGCYGLRVHEEALKRGVKITGATVHFVDEGMDTGPIIMQKTVKVHEDDTPETLQKRVMEEAEWVILPWCINLIAAGSVKVENGKVIVTE